MTIQFYESPFYAIEDSEVKAAEMTLKADLAVMIRGLISQKSWKEADAATYLGITQPRVSDLVNGKIEKFSLDTLFTILHTLGFRAKFTSLNEGEAMIKLAEKFS